MCPVSVALRRCQTAPAAMTAVGCEPLRLRTGTRSQRLRPLGQTVRWHNVMARCKGVTVDHNVWFACGCPTWVYGCVMVAAAGIWCVRLCHVCVVCVRMPVSSWLVLARMHDSGGGVSSLAPSACRVVCVPVACGPRCCRVSGPASASRRDCG